MEIETDRQDDILSLLVSGRVDGSNAAALEKTARTAIKENDRGVMMDFGNLSYISSSGLRVVLLIARRVISRGAKFALFALSDELREVFKISGFDQIISIHPSRTEALASLGA